MDDVENNVTANGTRRNEHDTTATATATATATVGYTDLILASVVGAVRGFQTIGTQ